MAELTTADLKGVELARTGKFKAVTGPVTFTTKDFDDMADAHKALAGKVDPPIKLGHNDGQELLQEDGLPAAGWVENLRREGDRLVADLMRVPQKIADLLKAGAWRKRSLEAVRNGEFAGKRFPMVLTGLALLGEELPAVDSLDDIEALYQAASLDTEWLPKATGDDAELVVMVVQAASEDGEDDVEQVIKDLQQVLQRAEALIRNRKGAPNLRSLVSTAVQELRRVGKKTAASANTGEGEMETKELATLLGLADDADEATIMEAAKALKAKVDAGEKGGADDGGKGDEGDGAAAELAALKASNVKLQGQVLELENRNATEDAAKAVDEAIKAHKLAPGVRETAIKMALSSREAFDQMVKDTPANAVLAAGEIGTVDDPDNADLSAYEPNAEDLKIMAQTDVSREQFILARIKESGHEEKVGQAVMAKLAGTDKKE